MRLLIVKTSSLGDIIHAFPVLEYLKQSQPDCLIDWVVEEPFAELVKAHPFVHKVIPIQTKKWRKQFYKKSMWADLALVFRALRAESYDLVLDLQGNTKSGLVTAMAKSSKKVGFDYSTASEWPNIFFTHLRYTPPTGKNIREDYLFLARSAFGETHGVPPLSSKGIRLTLSPNEQEGLAPILEKLKGIQGLKIVVCPGSHWPNKQISQQTLQAFLHCFPDELRPYFLLVWGNQNEKECVQEIAQRLKGRSWVIDRLSLPMLQNFMTHVDLVIAMDSLPLHLAGIASVRSYAVFGASSAQKYKPLGGLHEAFQGSCPYGKTFGKRCDILRSCTTGACMKQIQGKVLFDHFYSWWTTAPSGFLLDEAVTVGKM